MKKQKQDKRYGYDFLVNKIPYHIEVFPFLFNGQERFRIIINNGEEHIYFWDEETVQLRALDDGAAVLPDELETELSNRLIKTIVIK